MNIVPTTEDWITLPLSEIVVEKNGVQTGPFGSQLHKKDYVQIGTPIITVEHLGENRILHNKLPRVSDEDKERLAKYTLQEGDIVFSRVGSVDRRSFVRSPEAGWLFSGRCLRIRAKPEKIDPLYLSYYLGDPRVKQYVRSIAVGATMPSINTKILSDLPISLPLSQNKQIAIAHILETLGNKIALNQKMNQTLEEIATAIFKSWFVDFDLVRAKAEGRPTGLPPEISDLFPDELVESEIGEMPKGWEVTGLGSQLSFVLGGDWGKAKFSYQTPNRCLCIRGADIANLQCYIASGMPIRYLKDSSFTKRSLKPWDVVFEISGGSPTQSTGRSVLVTPEILENYDSPLTTSNFCRLLRFNSQASSLFHYYSFRSAYDRDEYFQYETGTTGIKNFGFKYYLENIKYVLPSVSCLTAFSNLVTPMIEKSGLTLQENEVLSSLRDTLLPKLISGELRIPNAEKFLEEAGV